jgi:RimK family alpha-L-glutamate ligase
LTVRIGILSSQLGWHARALQEALLEHHVTPVFFPITRLAAWIGGQAHLAVYEERLEDCQAILVRTIPIGSLEQIVFRMDALHRLEDVGVRVLNPAASIERTVDKYYTSYLLADAGISTPRTFVTEDFEQAMTAFQAMGDVIVKPLFGSEGKGMTRVSDEDTAYRLFRHLELCRYIFYLQEYIPHAEQDIRAFVIGGRVVAAMRRRGANWKTNYSKGAQVEPLQLTNEQQELSVRAARLVGTEYAGVDLLPAEDGRMYVLEVNSIPGWRGLRKTTSANIASLIVEHALKLLETDGIRL